MAVAQAQHLSNQPENHAEGHSKKIGKSVPDSLVLNLCKICIELCALNMKKSTGVFFIPALFNQLQTQKSPHAAGFFDVALVSVCGTVRPDRPL
jgi:hypothetical protein